MLLLEGVTLTHDARQLNGSERVVLDGLLTPAECGVLLQLAKVSPVSRWLVRDLRRSPACPCSALSGSPAGTALAPTSLLWTSPVLLNMGLMDTLYKGILLEIDGKNKTKKPAKA